MRIRRNLRKFVAIEHRAMARIPEDDGQQASVEPVDPQDRHVVIDRPLQFQPTAQRGYIGFLVGAAVDREITPPVAPAQPGPPGGRWPAR